MDDVPRRRSTRSRHGAVLDEGGSTPWPGQDRRLGSISELWHPFHTCTRHPVAAVLVCRTKDLTTLTLWCPMYLFLSKSMSHTYPLPNDLSMTRMMSKAIDVIASSVCHSRNKLQSLPGRQSQPSNAGDCQHQPFSFQASSGSQPHAHGPKSPNYLGNGGGGPSHPLGG